MENKLQVFYKVWLISSFVGTIALPLTLAVMAETLFARHMAIGMLVTMLQGILAYWLIYRDL